MQNRDGIESGEKSQGTASIWGSGLPAVVGTNIHQNSLKARVWIACGLKARTQKSCDRAVT
jgi:hypothetical protein